MTGGSRTAGFDPVGGLGRRTASWRRSACEHERVLEVPGGGPHASRWLVTAVSLGALCKRKSENSATCGWLQHVQQRYTQPPEHVTASVTKRKRLSD